MPCTCKHCTVASALFKEITSDSLNQRHECPESVLAAMIVSCRSRLVKKLLFEFYFVMEEGANPYNIIDMVLVHIKTLKKDHEDESLLYDIHQRVVDYRDYLDDKKFAKLYLYYRSKLNKFVL